MSENPESKLTLKAGAEIIERCPFCTAEFAKAGATNIKHTCPNPNCGMTFSIMVFEK